MSKKIKIIILLIIIIVTIIKLDIFHKKEIKITKPNIIAVNNDREDENNSPTLTEKEKDESSTVKEEVKKEEVKKPVTFSCPSPQKEYDDMSLLNIGQDTSLEDTTYIPKNLEKLSSESSTKSNLCLEKNAKDKFELMVKDAKKDSIHIKASSAFRTYSTQKTLYENDLKASGEKTSLSVAKAGYSEHQLGTTVDITGSSIEYVSASDKFDGTKEDEWLKKNSYLYGFIQSYPSGKEDITGYKYEPWHYRYVGEEKAKEIKDFNLTIKESLE